MSKDGKGVNILIGPGKKAFFINLLLICFLGWISCCGAYEINERQYLLTIIACSITLTSYLLTSLLDPGIIWSVEENSDSLESNEKTQSSDTVYCAICGVQRPHNANHCLECNVCYKDWDHHCTFLGICIAKNNRLFYRVLEVSLIIFGLFSYKNNIVNTIIKKAQFWK